MKTYLSKTYHKVKKKINTTQTILEYYNYPNRIEKDIIQIMNSSEPIVVGPWVSEVGFEILYWIPFLNWLKETFSVERKRFYIISRGGVQGWYAHISDHYIDIFDYFTPQEFKEKNDKRISEIGGQKHTSIANFDKEILMRIQESLNIECYQILHPSLMYNLFLYFWKRHRTIRQIERHSIYKPFAPISTWAKLEGLPKEYVAVKFYFRPSFPDTAANRKFIATILKGLTKKTSVVLLETGLEIDDHYDFSTQSEAHIYGIKELIQPNNNLEVQTKIVSGASAFIGTYGGFSYLAPFYGVPSLSFHSEEGYLHIHLDVMRRAFAKLGKPGNFIVADVADYDLMKLMMD